MSQIESSSRCMDDEVFNELVQVLSFSAEAAALMGGAPIPPALADYANGEAQVRGYDSWLEAAEVDQAEQKYAEAP
jgi:hypothetical protein